MAGFRGGIAHPPPASKRNAAPDFGLGSGHRRDRRVCRLSQNLTRQPRNLGPELYHRTIFSHGRPVVRRLRAILWGQLVRRLHTLGNRQQVFWSRWAWPVARPESSNSCAHHPVHPRSALSACLPRFRAVGRSMNAASAERRLSLQTFFRDPSAILVGPPGPLPC